MSQSEQSPQGSQAEPAVVAITQRSPLDETLREGAPPNAPESDRSRGRRLRGSPPTGGRRRRPAAGGAQQRSIVTGVGTLEVSAPRIADRRVDEQGRKCHFTSKILPPYLRRTKSVEELIPWLYLKGISTGDFSEALAALVGPDAPGLSATTVVRLKQVWRGEYERWSKRSLESPRFVYIWADGIYSNIRLDDERQCLLVVIGALADGLS